MWLEQARADYRAQGFARFWFGWRRPGEELRAAAFRHGRFTERARRWLRRYRLVQVPHGVAWSAAALAVALVPRWLPRAGALPRTPWVGAVCLHPLPLIAGVAGALTPEVVAHELAHALWPRLPRRLRAEFPALLQELERRNPLLTGWLDLRLAGYKDRRSPDECHVRLLEYYRYGVEPMPPELRPYYAGWIDLSSLPGDSEPGAGARDG